MRERVRLVGATNCGRKARKKIDSFGLRMLIRIAVDGHLQAGARADLASRPERAVLPQRVPRHVEQIGDARDT